MDWNRITFSLVPRVRLRVTVFVAVMGMVTLPIMAIISRGSLDYLLSGDITSVVVMARLSWKLSMTKVITTLKMVMQLL